MPDRPSSVPSSVDVAVAWTWRLAVLLGGVVLVGLVLGRVLFLTASFTAGLLLTALLQPLSGQAQRRGLPRRLAAVGVLVAFLLLVGVGLTTLGGVVAAQVGDLGAALSDGRDRLLDALRSAGLSQGQLDRLREQAGGALSSGGGGVATGALSAAATLLDVLSGAGLALFVALVLLLDGRTVWEWVLRLLPRSAQQPADEAGRRAWESVTSYVRGIAVVALVDASLIAVALLLLGVPAVAPLAALTFVGAFLPYVGAALAGLAAVAVALVDGGAVLALATLGAVLAVQTVDGYLLEPLVLGKAVRLHPLAVVVVITLGGLLAGVGGAVVAVPLAAAVNEAVVHLVRRGRAGDGVPGPAAGSP